MVPEPPPMSTCYPATDTNGWWNRCTTSPRVTTTVPCALKFLRAAKNIQDTAKKCWPNHWPLPANTWRETHKSRRYVVHISFIGLGHLNSAIVAGLMDDGFARRLPTHTACSHPV